MVYREGHRSFSLTVYDLDHGREETAILELLMSALFDEASRLTGYAPSKMVEIRHVAGASDERRVVIAYLPPDVSTQFATLCASWASRFDVTVTGDTERLGAII